MVLQDLSDAERQHNGIGETEMGLSVKRVSRGGRRFKRTNEMHERAGIRRGDIVIAYGNRD